MSAQQQLQENHRVKVSRKQNSGLSPYPIDMSPFLVLLHSTNEVTGMSPHNDTGIENLSAFVQSALAHWNQYLVINDENSRSTFLIQAQWLVEHQVCIGGDASGWPIPLPHSKLPPQRLALSAVVQGCALSVLVRAHQVTRDDTFMKVACSAVRTFERDILDGGISAPLGEEGIFFEEVAVYPAAHAFTGFIFAILGLYDYEAATEDTHAMTLIMRSLATLHRYVHEFDLGYWTCVDLLSRSLATPSHLALQIKLLEALAVLSDCNHCSVLASQWSRYLRKSSTRLRYLIMRCSTSFGCKLLARVRSRLFPTICAAQPQRVCVTLPSFPIAGGILTVLEGIAQVTSDRWHLEYLTQYVGPQQPEQFIIHHFGTAKMTPWLFPGLWLYFLAGFRKLMLLLHQGAAYHVILPQDAIFTGGFSALVAKLAGIRVICLDHGDLTLLHNHQYRVERLNDLTRKRWHPLFRHLMQWLLMFYWPSRYLQARIAACCVDHFLIPGIAGDGIEDICTGLGIPRSRITRFASMIDTNRHLVPDTPLKVQMRQQRGIAADAIVVAIVCRFAPEKGLDIAVESISAALSGLVPHLRQRVRVIIAGDGPLCEHLEAIIRTQGIQQQCLLWGTLATQEVPSLLAISDIFLYTSVRGACLPMAILEAMASACAVIASTQPASNAVLLAEGRGIVVPPGDVARTSEALVQLMNDPEGCKRMGKLAREYVVAHHSPAAFRRTLMRVTSWAALHELWEAEPK